MTLNLPSILLWGFVATLALTLIQSGSQELKVSRMSMPLMLGTALTGDWDRAQLYGFGLHFGSGWLFSLLYALVFDSLGTATWWLGALGGLFHALFILVAVLPVLPAVHPRMASERRQPAPTPLLEPPGFLALNYGARTPLVVVASHLVYGILLGLFYQPTG